MSFDNRVPVTINLHRVESIAIDRHMPDNANAIALRIGSEDSLVSLVLFGLPDETVQRVIDALGPPAHVIRKEPALLAAE